MTIDGDSMTLQQLRRQLRQQFQAHGIGSPEADSGLLLMYALELTKTQLLLRDFELTEAQRQTVSTLAGRRLAGEPVQYITGTCPFMDLIFTVNPATLIPRQDTELLVEAVSARLGAFPAPISLWDIGCGSGCIGISLAHQHPSLQVTELDISAAALRTAAETARRYHLEDRIRFQQHDILTGMPELPPPDVIVSNPPYIPSGHIAGLQREVREHEPLAALDGGADGLCFYRRILADAPLRTGGLLAFEIGYDQGETVPALMRAGEYQDVTLLHDLGGNPRVALGLRI